jgi:hypothetical protein
MFTKERNHVDTGSKLNDLRRKLFEKSSDDYLETKSRHLGRRPLTASKATSTRDLWKNASDSPWYARRMSPLLPMINGAKGLRRTFRNGCSDMNSNDKETRQCGRSLKVVGLMGELLHL